MLQVLLLGSLLLAPAPPPPPPPPQLSIDWGSTIVTTSSTPTCQVVVEPTMWPGSTVRADQLHWLKELGEEASPVFWQSWFVYPHTGVAQLRPGKWDFSQITPLLADMLNATKGRDLALQFGTVYDTAHYPTGI